MNLLSEAAPYWLQRALRWSIRVIFGVLELSVWSSWRIARAFVLMGLAAVMSVGAVVATATWEVLSEIPESSIALMDGRERGSVTVLDMDGGVLGLRGQRFRRLTVNDAAPVLIDAILSNEDRRFYWHFGLDPIGIARAVAVNWREERIVQGGSTITQQVAKLAFLSRDRKYARKLRELPLSLALEWRFSKDEILSIYLSRAYLGAGAFGFEAAARRHFGKSASEVNAAEAAVLSGLLRAPSRWSPSNDFGAAQDRARIVLRAMLDVGNLSPPDFVQARSDLDQLAVRELDETAPYFIDYVAEQVPDRIWEMAPDVVLRTSLDLRAQATAKAAVDKVLSEKGGRDENAEAAVVLLAPDGAVKAMIGGRDYTKSLFNRAVLAKRQLGSAFKPIVYAAALEAGVSPNALVHDSPIRIRNWLPKNYSHRYLGWLPLATALAKSSNVAAVRLSQQAGVSSVVDMARRFGFEGDVPPYPSIALGVLGVSPLEVASAYSVFRNRGRVTPAYAIQEIISRETGEVLWKRQRPPRLQVISELNAEYVTSFMRHVVMRGTGRRAQMGERHVVGKTGTTQEYRDAWFAGFSASMLGVVWMGHDDNSKLDKVTGGSLPAEIWREIMAPIHRNEPEVELAMRDVEFLDYEPVSDHTVSIRRQRRRDRVFEEVIRRRPRRRDTRQFDPQTGERRTLGQRWWNSQNR